MFGLAELLGLSDIGILAFLILLTTLMLVTAIQSNHTKLLGRIEELERLLQSKPEKPSDPYPKPVCSAVLVVQDTEQ